jgi:hypothetical protein
MDREGLISLPAPTCRAGYIPASFQSERSDPKPLREVLLASLKNLHVDLVTGKKERSLWNEFVSRYHYLGYKMLPGAQLRDLIKDGAEVLGAMGFGAAAWKVEDRDKFIGWNPCERESRLHLIVNQSRFLILPWIKCKNLATKSLSLVARRICDDWQHQYAYRPVLMETFVDTTRFQGICYKAANWINVGLTKGRSKMDRYHTRKEPIKSIWLAPLRRDFRSFLVERREYVKED